MTTSHAYQQYNNKTIYGIKSNAARYAWAGYLLFVVISSFIGDTIILIASVKYNAFKIHKIIVVIIQHIAFCDLMVTLTTVAPQLVSLIRSKWVFGNVLRYLTVYIRYFFAGAGPSDRTWGREGGHA